METSPHEGSSPVGVPGIPRGNGASTGDLPRRAAVTVGVVLAFFAARKVPIPGVDVELVRAALRTGSTEQFSVLATGVTPVVSGFLLVEILALLIPSWRPLREDAAGRTVLQRRVLVAVVLLAVLQGMSLSSWMMAFNHMGMWAVREPGTLFRVTTVTTLLAGNALLWWGISAITRWGLGNGFVAVTLAAMVPGAWQQAVALFLDVRDGQLDRASILRTVVGLALVLGATAWALAWRHQGRLPNPASIRVRFPAAGVNAVVLAASLLMLPSSLGWTTASSPPGPVPQAALGVLFTVLLGWLFHRPLPVATAFARRAGIPVDEPMRAAARDALMASIAVSSLWCVGAALLPQAGFPFVLAASSALQVVAALMDLGAEVRAIRTWGVLSCVGQTHRVYQADAMAGALADAGIPSLARTLHMRSLGHFFAPHLPVEIMVPQDRDRAARDVLARFSPAG
jgi:hypothetical protein